MRRVLPSLLLLLLGAGGAVHGQAPANPTLLGAGGEVYRVQRGAYRDLFPNAPAAQAGNPVLALDVVRDGKPLQRTLVPGSDDAAPEQAVALAADGAHVYLLWGDGRQIEAVGFGADSGWDTPYVLDLDPASQKLNPQLVATADHFSAAAADGSAVALDRTILHLVWVDRGAAGDRVLYTALVSEAGVLQRANRVIDLQQLAGSTPGAFGGAPQALLQKPQVRAGRDGKSALVGFVDRSGSELVTLELRPVGGDVTSFADFARAVTIETGRQNPGATHAQIADKARAVTIETGHQHFKPAVADAMAKAFLDDVAHADEMQSLDDAAESAAQDAIAQGASLLTLPDKADSDVELLALAGPDDGPAGRQVLDLRRASRRALPNVTDGDVRLFLSLDGDDAAIAWSGAGFVRYRESDGDGWSAVRNLTLGPSLGVEDAFALVQQRIASR